MEILQKWHRNPKIICDCGHITRAENARWCNITGKTYCKECADKEWRANHIHIIFSESLEKNKSNKRG